MPRPTKLRRVCKLPHSTNFGPENKMQNKLIRMTVDEYETIRLIDLEGLTQEQCANKMEVARTTTQSIYTSARKKLAECLVNGLSLVIEGGEYQICECRELCAGVCCRNIDCNVQCPKEIKKGE